MAAWPTHRAKAQFNHKLQLRRLKQARRRRRIEAGGKRA